MKSTEPNEDHSSFTEALKSDSSDKLTTKTGHALTSFTAYFFFRFIFTAHPPNPILADSIAKDKTKAIAIPFESKLRSFVLFCFLKTFLFQ